MRDANIRNCRYQNATKIKNKKFTLYDCNQTTKDCKKYLGVTDLQRTLFCQPLSNGEPVTGELDEAIGTLLLPDAAMTSSKCGGKT